LKEIKKKEKGQIGRGIEKTPTNKTTERESKTTFD
jgi:hypothetical protein